jgi:glutamate 5-kinase
MNRHLAAADMSLSALQGEGGVTAVWSPAAALAGAKRIVVKIGSALLVQEDGEIRRAWLDSLVADVARCRGRGQEVVIVTSGAIAIGRRHLGLRGRVLRLDEKQAAAATGARPSRSC